MQLSALTSSLGRFFSELHRHKVLRVASLYVVTGWIVLQVALALQTAMALPAGFSTVILSLLIIVLPVALVLSWFFDFTPQGIKRTAGAGEGALAQPQTTDWILIGLLVVVAGATVLQAALPRTSEAPPAATAEQATPAPKPETPALGDKSIAVLPFANLSPDKENEYFADGLTEELLNLLAKIGDLKVVSRASSFAFKGKDTPLPEIAKQLGVRHILEGSVRNDGDNLRVTAQLIDVSTDTHLWTETYERKIENVFALQDEIARAIAGALKIEVALSSTGREAPTKNLEAYRLYLEGLERRARGALPSPEVSDLFKQATILDPMFAEAHAALAASYATRIGVSPSQYLELATLARNSAQVAIDLKPTLGFAHGVLGLLDRMASDWESAIAKGEKAVALSPFDSNARLWLAGTQLGLGYIDRAADSIDNLRQVDPLFDYAASMEMIVEMARGNEQIAESLAKAAIDRGLGLRVAHYVLTALSYDRGNAVEAARHYKLFLNASLRGQPFVATVARAFGDPNAKDAAVTAILSEAIANPAFDPYADLGLLKAYDAMFSEYERRLASGKRTGFNVQGFALLLGNRHKPVRSDPRFKSFLRDAGLVDYWKKHGWPDKCRPQGADDFVCD